MTGANSPNNTKQRFNIGGTDLGIMWDNGIKDNPATTDVNEHQVLIAFGDTFSHEPAIRMGDWRMNTLFRSYDNTLSNGMFVPDGIIHDAGTYSGSPMSEPNWSREIIGNYHYGIGPEVTMIPTAAISVPGAGAGGATRQYINFMAVRSWDTPGRWTTNYSAIAYSDDNGQNWRVVPASSVRSAAVGRSTVPFVSGNQNFQQFAYVKGAVVDANGVPVKDPVTGQPKTDGYIYAYGTPSGRGGTAYLSRVKEGEILDQTKYQYWNGSTWVANRPSAATPVLPGTTTSWFFGLFKTDDLPHRRRDVGAVQRVREEVHNALRRSEQQRRDEESGPAARAVVGANNFGDIRAEARSVCADDSPVVWHGQPLGGRTAVSFLEFVDLG